MDLLSLCAKVDFDLRESDKKEGTEVVPDL